MRHLAAVVVVVALASCGGSDPAPRATPAATPQQTPAVVVGLITEITPAKGTPQSLVIEEDDGDVYTILIDPDFDYGFDLNHLRIHEDDRLPVEVGTRADNGDLYATAILDA